MRKHSRPLNLPVVFSSESSLLPGCIFLHWLIFVCLPQPVLCAIDMPPVRFVIVTGVSHIEGACGVKEEINESLVTLPTPKYKIVAKVFYDLKDQVLISQPD